jgi:beta-mannosidase
VKTPLLRLFLLAFLLFMQSASTDASEVHSRLSNRWEFRRVGDSRWIPATVPGNCYTDLLSNAIIPDPFIADNEKGVQWIDTCSWDYRTVFMPDEKLLSCRNRLLQFDGIDTYAEVFLNGKKILYADNMFRIWEVDVTDFLLRGPNELLVRFSPAMKKAAEAAAAYPQKLPGGDRVFTRKAAFQWGWDFGPKFLGCGIWKEVRLVGRSGLNITDVCVKETRFKGKDALLKIELAVDGAQASDATVEVVTENDVQPVLTQRVKLSAGNNKIAVRLPVRRVKRWFTHQLGNPFCYDFRLSVRTSAGDSAVRKLTYGIRELELVQQKDSIGRSFFFRLNGIPVFMKGANLVPPDHFVHRIDSATQARLIADARSSNFNMIRIWGGGIYPDDRFYELCDRNGILVWQDFMAACSMIPADKSFLVNMREEVRQQVVRLRNHASLAVWCGNNECDEGWHNWGWQKEFAYSASDSAAVWHDYLRVFHEMIPEVLKQEDPSRSYWPSSPSIGWGRPASLRSGDAHYWGVWWGHEPFSVYEKKTGRFMTEYGFQGMPAMKSVQSFLGGKTPELSDPALKAHQKHPTGFETIREYMERDHTFPADFRNYVYLSQFVQREGICSAIASHRRQRARCMGTLYWQFNDSWPGISWSSRDYYGRWKSLQYAMQDVYSTLFITTVADDRKVDIHVVSDSTGDFLARMELRLIDVYGNLRWSEIVPADIRAGASSLVCTRDFRRIVKDADTVNVILNTRIFKGDAVVAERNHYFCQNRNLNLVKPAMTVRTITSDDGVPRIELKSSSFIRCLEVSLRDDPSLFDKNYFDMFPGERYVLTLTSGTLTSAESGEIHFRSLIDTF